MTEEFASIEELAAGPRKSVEHGWDLAGFASGQAQELVGVEENAAECGKPMIAHDPRARFALVSGWLTTEGQPKGAGDLSVNVGTCLRDDAAAEERGLLRDEGAIE